MSNSKFTEEITKIQNDSEVAFKQFQVSSMLEAIGIIKQYPTDTYNNYVLPADISAYKNEQDQMASQFAGCKWYKR